MVEITAAVMKYPAVAAFGAAAGYMFEESVCAFLTSSNWVAPVFGAIFGIGVGAILIDKK